MKTFFVSPSFLEMCCEVNSCMGLSADKPTVEKIIDFQGKLWVCVGSLSRGSNWLRGTLCECVPANQYQGPAYKKAENRYRGLRFMCAHVMDMSWVKSREFVFTGLQVVVRVVNPFEKNLYRAMR